LLQGTLYILVFLIAVVVFARVRSHGIRQLVLLAGSYALYLTWTKWFVVVLFASTAINYLVGQWLRRKPAWPALSAGIFLNLALLAAFKYLPEVATNLPFSSLQSFAHLALPLGMSFWTFQAMSYLFDLYRGEELDPTFAELALYMAFFPVSISGPVCRMPDMLAQFRCEDAVKASDRERGFSRIAIGVLMMQFGKLLGQGILAGGGINEGFDRITRWSGPDVWCLAVGFGLQLFFDFAGYSHIAIGAARMLGITVPENFDRPFASTTPSVFWTRWHMSLSFWIRDYVFLPLAMLRRGMLWRNLVLVLAMVLFGVWHKASVLFVIWGLYHGVLLVAHRQVQQIEKRIAWEPPAAVWAAVSWIITMLLVSLGWIFFRATSLAEARQMLSAVSSPETYSVHFLSGSLYLLVLLLAIGYAGVAMMSEVLNRHADGAVAAEGRSGTMTWLARKRWYWVPPLYALALMGVLMVTMTQGATTALFMYRAF
jgi:D-alanyl-lipoteichoic acid acyltransferase DltB (MBOAT superfamily)